jgi:hypothetical protein
MSHVGNTLLTSREEAERLLVMRQRMELAHEDSRPFSSYRMFQDLAMTGALDVMPDPNLCRPLASLIRHDSPFIKGREMLSAVIVEAEQQSSTAVEAQILVDLEDEGMGTTRHVERPRE